MKLPGIIVRVWQVRADRQNAFVGEPLLRPGPADPIGLGRFVRKDHASAGDRLSQCHVLDGQDFRVARAGCRVANTMGESPAPRAADPGRPLSLSEHISRTLRLAVPASDTSGSRPFGGSTMIDVRYSPPIWYRSQ